MKAKPLTEREARNSLLFAIGDHARTHAAWYADTATDRERAQAWRRVQRAITAYSRACRAEGQRGKQ